MDFLTYSGIIMLKINNVNIRIINKFDNYVSKNNKIDFQNIHFTLFLNNNIMYNKLGKLLNNLFKTIQQEKNIINIFYNN
jgi:DNA recombination-dependent growth factor C